MKNIKGFGDFLNEGMNCGAVAPWWHHYNQLVESGSSKKDAAISAIRKYPHVAGDFAELMEQEIAQYTVQRISPKDSRKFGLDMWEAVVEPSERDLSTIVEASKSAYGIMAGDKIVGAFTFKRVSFADATEIEVLLVDPAYRGKGVGKTAVEFVCKEADSAYVIAHPHTNDSENFFGKMGFAMDENFDDNDPNTMVRKIS